ncbi:outer membrane beta-barrel protein [Marinicellulosiphila megalodicopiae]|uniref:outer membrane beta-barrel protein n=1 Tax=Marinicellulosiphila megalodicopiae TaxID=2724896 RepID=UPI003BAF4E50
MTRLLKTGSLISLLVVSSFSLAYKHDGFQWSAGVGGSFSVHNSLQNNQYDTTKQNAGYAYNIDLGYGWTNRFSTFLSIHNVVFQSQLDDVASPEPLLMQLAYVGPIIRFYGKSNQPSWYFQSGVGYGYHSVSELSSIPKVSTSRHAGNATTFGIGYEVDMFWTIGLDYIYADIQSETSNEDLRLSSHGLVFSLNLHPRSTY